MPLLTNYRAGGEWVREQQRKASEQELLNGDGRSDGRSGGDSSASLHSPQSSGRDRSGTSEEGDSLVLQERGGAAEASPLVNALGRGGRDGEGLVVDASNDVI